MSSSRCVMVGATTLSAVLGLTRWPYPLRAVAELQIPAVVLAHLRIRRGEVGTTTTRGSPDIQGHRVHRQSDTGDLGANAPRRAFHPMDPASTWRRDFSVVPPSPWKLEAKEREKEICYDVSVRVARGATEQASTQ